MQNVVKRRLEQQLLINKVKITNTSTQTLARLTSGMMIHLTHLQTQPRNTDQVVLTIPTIKQVKCKPSPRSNMSKFWLTD